MKIMKFKIQSKYYVKTEKCIQTKNYFLIYADANKPVLFKCFINIFVMLTLINTYTRFETYKIFMHLFLKNSRSLS